MPRNIVSALLCCLLYYSPHPAAVIKWSPIRAYSISPPLSQLHWHGFLDKPWLVLPRLCLKLTHRVITFAQERLCIGVELASVRAPFVKKKNRAIWNCVRAELSQFHTLTCANSADIDAPEIFRGVCCAKNIPVVFACAEICVCTTADFADLLGTFLATRARICHERQVWTPLLHRRLILTLRHAAERARWPSLNIHC